jgi:ribosomal protein L31
MGGSDDPSNIVKLTIKEHAEAHKKLYEKYGKWEDKVAWLSLSKQISCAEATRLAQSTANKNKTPDQINACNRNRQLALKAWTGNKHTENSKKRISKSNKKYWGKIKNRPWQKRTFFIEGKEYLGIDQVMKKYKFKTMGSIYYRIKSKKYPNWTNKGGFKNGRS